MTRKKKPTALHARFSAAEHLTIVGGRRAFGPRRQKLSSVPQAIGGNLRGRRCARSKKNTVTTMLFERTAPSMKPKDSSRRSTPCCVGRELTRNLVGGSRDAADSQSRVRGVESTVLDDTRPGGPRAVALLCIDRHLMPPTETSC